MNVTRRGLVGAGAAALLAVAAFAPIGSPGTACVTVLERVAEVRSFYDAADEVTLTSAERTDMNRDLALATKAENQCLATGTTTTTVPTTNTTVPTTTTTVPQQTGFPNASNTGPSGTLAPSDSITTSAHGQVIQNLSVDGQIRVEHNNVTIRNVKISSLGSAIYTAGTTGLVVEDCELDGRNASAESAIAEHNYTMRRCEIRNHGEGPRINGNVTLEGNYIHSFPNFISSGAHQDCIQITSGSNIVIRNNTCMMQLDGGNAAIMTGSYTGNDLLFENNLLAGGGYTVYCGDNQYTNVTVRNNRISTVYFPRGGYHGPFVDCSQAAMSNNVWHDGPNAGQPAT